MRPGQEPIAEEITPLQRPAKGHGDPPCEQPYEQGPREEFATLGLESKIVTYLRAEVLQACGCLPVVRSHVRRSHRSRASTARRLPPGGRLSGQTPARYSIRALCTSQRRPLFGTLSFPADISHDSGWLAVRRGLNVEA